MTKEWLLMKRGLYYLPNNCGYTGIKDQAGRYSLEEMNDSVKAGNGVTGIHEGGAPEFTMACFDDLARDHLTKQRDEARAALERVWNDDHVVEHLPQDTKAAIRAALGHQQSEVVAEKP